MENVACAKTSINFKCFEQHTVSPTRIYKLKLQNTDNKNLSKINSIEMRFKLMMVDMKDIIRYDSYHCGDWITDSPDESYYQPPELSNSHITTAKLPLVP